MQWASESFQTEWRAFQQENNDRHIHKHLWSTTLSVCDEKLILCEEDIVGEEEMG